MRNETQTYTTLRERMHEALAAEHPEWIEADGESPMLDLYDARFAEVLTLLRPRAAESPVGEDARRKAARVTRIRKT